MKTHKDIISDSLTKSRHLTDEWHKRHVTEWFNKGPIASIIIGLAQYADNHQFRYESRLGVDYVLGPAWAQSLANMRELLNGELGRLDGGTLDGLILDMLALEGFDENGEKVPS